MVNLKVSQKEYELILGGIANLIDKVDLNIENMEKSQICGNEMISLYKRRSEELHKLYNKIIETPADIPNLIAE